MKKRLTLQFETRVILSTGLLTFLLLTVLFAFNHIAPFGSNTLAVMDADIQYLDFFSYFKDVLAGKNSLGYTFSKTLGGSSIAVFSYYLSSPFNLLLLFFSKQQIPVFFNLVVALKLILASVAFAYFSVHRFQRTPDEHACVYVLLSVGYGLCQYNLAQSSNIMWLDGVYMLPFILLQVSYLVRGKSARALPFLVGAAILFNWYSAGLDCLFTGFWFLFEVCLLYTEEKSTLRGFIHTTVHYVVSMVLGVLLSAGLFLPTIGALQKSTRGSLHFGDLKNLSLIGNPLTAFQNYTYGSISGLGSVALFCGSLTIILVLSVFFNPNIPLPKRLLLGGLFAGSLLSFYWKPLYVAFSLFQWVSSYHYRYSYLAVFVFLFLALYGNRAITKGMLRRIAFIAIGYALTLLILFQIRPFNTRARVYFTAFFILLTSASYLLLQSLSAKSSSRRRALFAAAFSLVFSVDLLLNASLLMRHYSIETIPSYQTYHSAQEAQIAAIKAADPSFYRISQTTTRTMVWNSLTAYYNEGMAYNYASISGYTSSPDDNQREFLDRLGYRINGENMCITNSSILGADSLLGVKYILSPYSIPGLEKTALETAGNKIIYKNPYAFPMAFLYTPQSNTASANRSGNPFEYQNALYQELFGLNENLYVPLDYTFTSSPSSLNIHLSIPSDGNFVVYGSIPWNSNINASILADSQYITRYACWLSPDVFYIPVSGTTCELEVQASSMDFKLDQMQFYALDLDALEQYAALANARRVDSLSIENGSVRAMFSAHDGEQLFLSIPNDEGWQILLNGVPAETELIGDCLYSVKLVEGTNALSMTYHIRYLKAGIIISLLTLLFLCLVFVLDRKNLLPLKGLSK